MIGVLQGRGLVAQLEVAQPKLSDRKIEMFAETGRMTLLDALPIEAVDVIRSACKRTFRLFPSKVLESKSREWHKVGTVPLQRGLISRDGWSGAQGLVAPELEVTQKWADRVIRKLGFSLMEVGFEDEGQMITNFSGNSTLINRMRGTLREPSRIGMHTDLVQEHGVNAVLTLGKAIDLITEDLVPANTLYLYACQDLGRAFGYEPPIHGFDAYEERFSVVFRNFFEGPAS
jgi:hypothetical protein